MAITATISDNNVTVRKAILVQAKIGRVEDLSTRESERLNGQIVDMSRFNRSPKVLEIYKDYSIPTIVSGRGILEKPERIRHFRFDRWFSSFMLPTLHGDTRPGFVAAVQDAKLSQLKVQATVKN